MIHRSSTWETLYTGFFLCKVAYSWYEAPSKIFILVGCILLRYIITLFKICLQSQLNSYFEECGLQRCHRSSHTASECLSGLSIPLLYMIKLATEYFCAPPSCIAKAECLECELLYQDMKSHRLLCLTNMNCTKKCRPLPQPVQIYLNIWCWNLVPQNSQFNFIQTLPIAKLSIRNSAVQDIYPALTPVSLCTDNSVYITVITVLGVRVACNSAYGHLKICYPLHFLMDCSEYFFYSCM
jgi:hypothetical protein